MAKQSELEFQHELICELAGMASTDGHHFLAYLLDMACHEAEELSARVAADGHKVGQGGQR